MSLSRQLSGLARRFDTLALNPPAQVGAPAAGPLPCLEALQAWCQHGSGPGGMVWWRPGRLPRVAQRLAVAALTADNPAQAVLLANQLALGLDGSLRLAALGRGAGLGWRLQVKLADACWWRARQPQDPWDAGWARTAPPSLRHLTRGFAPRRATLVLADAADASLLALPLAHLVQRADSLPHPVRWLWVGTPGACAALAAEPRFALG
jgi:hypothetical protein